MIKGCQVSLVPFYYLRIIVYYVGLYVNLEVGQEIDIGLVAFFTYGLLQKVKSNLVSIVIIKSKIKILDFEVKPNCVSFALIMRWNQGFEFQNFHPKFLWFNHISTTMIMMWDQNYKFQNAVK